MKLVIVESPYAGRGDHPLERTFDRQDNENYARQCLKHCLMNDEAPFASHLLYTQPNVLRDYLSRDRSLGIEAGLCWGQKADETAVYVDRGVTEGMLLGIKRAFLEGRPVSFRSLNKDSDALDSALASVEKASEDW